MAALTVEATVETTAADLVDDDYTQSRARNWILFAIFALLFHLLLYFLKPLFPAYTSTTPPRIEVQQVDPKKLEAIKRQWERERQKSLLLSKDKSPPQDAPRPKDARYFSDRNRIFEKEQRARQTDVLPHAGNGTADHPSQPAAAPPKAASAQRAAPLAKLGIPMHLDRSSQPPPPPNPQADHASTGGEQRGADQDINDRTLPEGGENLLNTEQSVYYSFYARLYEAIAPIWQSMVREQPQEHISAGDYTTQVTVLINADGDLVGIEQHTSSGIRQFDQAVERAWRKIGHFPNPPHGLINGQGVVATGWTFTVRLSNDIGLQAMPPSRSY